jgi:hypothetical protein
MTFEQMQLKTPGAADPLGIMPNVLQKEMR